MPLRRIRENTGPPPYVESYRHALNQLRDRPVLDDEQARDRAAALLQERFGPVDETPAVAFVRGTADLMSHHTHYFDGFGVAKVLPYGTAVAMRHAGGDVSQVIFDGAPEAWRFGSGENGATEDGASAWGRVFEQVMQALQPADLPLEVAVVSSVQPACMDAYLTELAVATARACQQLFGLANDRATVRRQLQNVLSTCAGRPFGVAGLLAAEADKPDNFVLVDAARSEYLTLEAPGDDEVAWGLVDVGEEAVQDAAFYRRRQDQAEEALYRLRTEGFEKLRSFRELEHQQLQRAVQVLPEALRPVIRHLVTENRRVQRLVAAIRKNDWQLAGALLLMGHASLRDDWGGSTAAADLAVSVAEEMTIEGVHGARLTGRDRCVLVVGRSFVVPQCLDRIQAAFDEHYGRIPEAKLL